MQRDSSAPAHGVTRCAAPARLQRAAVSRRCNCGFATHLFTIASREDAIVERHPDGHSNQRAKCLYVIASLLHCLVQSNSEIFFVMICTFYGITYFFIEKPKEFVRNFTLHKTYLRYYIYFLFNQLKYNQHITRMSIKFTIKKVGPRMHNIII